MLNPCVDLLRFNNIIKDSTHNENKDRIRFQMGEDDWIQIFLFIGDIR